MSSGDLTAHHVAAIMNAAWHVRYLCRPHQGDRRRLALARMAQATLQALTEGIDSEAVLYAVAQGLYDRTDPRFLAP